MKRFLWFPNVAMPVCSSGDPLLVLFCDPTGVDPHTPHPNRFLCYLQGSSCQAGEIHASAFFCVHVFLDRIGCPQEKGNDRAASMQQHGQQCSKALASHMGGVAPFVRLPSPFCCLRFSRENRGRSNLSNRRATHIRPTQPAEC